MDVRLKNVSQLAGFTKKDDLAFFCRELAGIEYVHEPALSPTDDILKAYKKKEMSWDQYESQFLALLTERRVEDRLAQQSFESLTVLLCSEPEPKHCHRRLVAEYLRDKWGSIQIRHL